MATAIATYRETRSLRETVARLIASYKATATRRAKIRAVEAQMFALSDHDLWDIGVDRANIPEIARAHVDN